MLISIQDGIVSRCDPHQSVVPSTLVYSCKAFHFERSYDRFTSTGIILTCYSDKDKGSFAFSFMKIMNEDRTIIANKSYLLLICHLYKFE